MSCGSVVEGVPTRQNRKSHIRTIEKSEMPSLAQQQFKDECDINNIINKFMSDPYLIEEAKMRNPGIYADFSEAPDYLEAQNVLLRAKNQFDALPSKIRAQFDNDPQQFLQFVHDPKNGKELLRLGLAEAVKPTPETPTEKALKEVDKTLKERLPKPASPSKQQKEDA